MKLTVNRSIEDETPIRLRDLSHGTYTCNVGHSNRTTLLIKGYPGHGAVGLDSGLDYQSTRSWVHGSDDWNHTELRNVKLVKVDAVTVTETGESAT